MVRLYKEEVLDICKDGTFMGIWQIFQLANVIKWPICSVHPNIGNPNVRKDLHRTVYCIDNTYNAQSPLHIMWTPMQVNAGQRPCHFVPLLRVLGMWIHKINDLYNLTLDLCILCFILAALTNAVKATSARLRSASRKKDGGEEGTVV